VPEIMKEEASVRNFGCLKSLIRPADGPAMTALLRATEVVNRRVRNLFRKCGLPPGVGSGKRLRHVVAPSASPFQATFRLDETDDFVEPLALLQVGHDKGARPAHPSGVRVHLLQGGADMGREVDLVDDQKI